MNNSSGMFGVARGHERDRSVASDGAGSSGSTGRYGRNIDKANNIHRCSYMGASRTDIGQQEWCRVVRRFRRKEILGARCYASPRCDALFQCALVRRRRAPHRREAIGRDTSADWQVLLFSNWGFGGSWFRGSVELWWSRSAYWSFRGRYSGVSEVSWGYATVGLWRC